MTYYIKKKTDIEIKSLDFNFKVTIHMLIIQLDYKWFKKIILMINMPVSIIIFSI
jgi:hypothetical protein